MRGNRGTLLEIGGQKCRVEVALHRSDATGALVPALRERLFHRLAAAVAQLRQLGGARGNLAQGAARACNGAFQETDKHPWSPQSHTLAVLLDATLCIVVVGISRPRPIIWRWSRRIFCSCGVSCSQNSSRLASASRGTRAMLDGPRSAPMISLPTRCFGLW